MLVLVLVVPLGLGTKFYAGPGEIWVHAHAGGFFYVLFWCVLAFAAWPRRSAWTVGGAVLAVTCALEFSQLWHPPELEAVRATFLGHALLGSTFSWSDFPYYLAGMLAAVGVARICAKSAPPSRRMRTKD